MVSLRDVNAANYSAILRLRVKPGQEEFVAPAANVLARAYAMRAQSARVFVIAEGDEPVGLAMVRGIGDAPARYELNQFFIDGRYQGRGYGTQALLQILALLAAEGAYGRLELSVRRDNAAAIRLYRKIGFYDTLRTDPAEPELRILAYRIDGYKPGIREKIKIPLRSLTVLSARMRNNRPARR